MPTLAERLGRFRVTASLLGVVCVVYGLQLTVAERYGQHVAAWWFYQQPGGVTPGLVFAPLSHNTTSPTHLLANALGLLIVGSYAEQHLSTRRYLGVTVLLGYAGLYLANAVGLLLGHSWTLAGLSAGLLSLSAYIGLDRQVVVREASRRETPRWEYVLVMSLLLSVVAIPLAEVSTPPANLAHVVGVLLGVLCYAGESLAG